MLRVLQSLLGTPRRPQKPQPSRAAGQRAALAVEALEDRLALSPWLQGQFLGWQRPFLPANGSVPALVFTSQTRATGVLQSWFDSLAGAPSSRPAYSLSGVMLDEFGYEETFSGYMVDFGNGWSYLDVKGLNISGGHMGEFKGWINDSGWASDLFNTSRWGWDEFGYYFSDTTWWYPADFQLEGTFTLKLW
jgi:hypothetical protein